MKFLRDKKGFLDPFDISGRLGYYVLTILMISVLFMFLAILLQGSTVKYYKSNYGTAAINLEERAFNLIEFVDPITNQKYTKVIDSDKLNSLQQNGVCSSLIDKEFGVDSIYDRKGVKIEFINSNEKSIINKSTCNYINGRADMQKNFPVLYTEDGSTFKLGEVRIYLWKP